MRRSRMRPNPLGSTTSTAMATNTLVVLLYSDNAITLPRGQAMAQAIPNAQLAVIAGAGHAANLTHPEAVNPVLEAFLATLA